MSGDAYDVVVVGAGNAALCAALSARERGASVLVLECAPREARGGNSYFTGGLVRFPFEGMDELRELVQNLPDAEADRIEVGSYSPDELYHDMARLTEGRADPALVSVLASEAYSTLHWMQSQGVGFELALRRQAFESDGVLRFFASAPLEFAGGGKGLVDALFLAAEKSGIEVRYSARAAELVFDSEGTIAGVLVHHEGVRQKLAARAVVLASGGFEANPEMRAKYLGPGWDLVKVRGTEYNRGDGLAMALRAGAQSAGHWSGCHAVAWDVNAPATGDRDVADGFQKHSYPYGIVVNRLGRRFLDEGADYRNYTYARYGREILAQPDMLAFQIFDAKVEHLLRDEYRITRVTRAESNSLGELAGQLGIETEPFVRTVSDFNDAVVDGPFDPSVLDGRRTSGIEPPKSNWAQPIDRPPYQGFAVTCGITFTFGGLRIDTDARVLDTADAPIAGLYAAGELVGGLFYHNYPGGMGLTSGAVFGRIAGRSAAAHAA